MLLPTCKITFYDLQAFFTCLIGVLQYRAEYYVDNTFLRKSVTGNFVAFLKIVAHTEPDI